MRVRRHVEPRDRRLLDGLLALLLERQGLREIPDLVHTHVLEPRDRAASRKNRRRRTRRAGPARSSSRPASGPSPSLVRLSAHLFCSVAIVNDWAPASLALAMRSVSLPCRAFSSARRITTLLWL